MNLKQNIVAKSSPGEGGDVWFASDRMKGLTLLKFALFSRQNKLS